MPVPFKNGVNRELAMITGPQAAIASHASNPDSIPAMPGSVLKWRAATGDEENYVFAIALHN